MDGDLEKKHCCKVCGKSFPSGRSLGGHMRSHLPLNSVTEADEKPKSSRSSLLMGTGYGLRGNPKKTWRLSDSSSGNSSMRDKLCGECGKRFPSWRSLFGHMRCHSARLRQALEEEEQEDEVRAQEFEEQEGSWSLGGDKLLESHSDTETMAAAVPRRRRRSRRVVVIPDSSSSVCEYEKEQEDVALSLMMLSRDTRFQGGIGSAITESSDKNSAVHEDKGVAQESCEHDAVNAKKKGAELGVVGNVCPKIWLNKVDLEFSDNVYVMDDEFKSDKFVSSEEELKDSSRKKNLSSIDELVRKAKFDHLDQEFSKCVLGKRGRLDACDTKFSGDFIARFGFRAPAPEKRSRFECTTCNKVFDSYQALGGHRASHKRTNGCLPSRMDSSEISIENNASVEPTQMEEVTNQNVGIKTGCGSLKRFKDHACPICGKLFYSGQALGGHKRSHFLTSSDACHQTMVIEQQSPALPNLLDLNLPAPVDEESSDTNGNAEFKPWWVGSELMRGSVVGLITN